AGARLSHAPATTEDFPPYTIANLHRHSPPLTCRLQEREMDIHREGDIEVVRLGPLGPYGNNAYIIADTAARESMIVDMPAEGEKILEALKEARVTSIVATHWHPDHWMSYDLVRGATGAPVY